MPFGGRSKWSTSLQKFKKHILKKCKKVVLFLVWNWIDVYLTPHLNGYKSYRNSSREFSFQLIRSRFKTIYIFSCFRLPVKVSRSSQAHFQTGHEVPMSDVRLCQCGEGSSRQARQVRKLLYYYYYSNFHLKFLLDQERYILNDKE